MKFDHLSERFGEDVARMLCEELGGDTVYFPVMRDTLKPRIVEMWANGLPTQVISIRLNCDESWVRRVIRSA